jgi:uncharacterized membrane protein
MYNRAELKNMAKQKMKGNWGSGALFIFVFGIINIVLEVIAVVLMKIGIPFVNILVMFVTAPMTFGFVSAFVQFVRDNKPLDVGEIFSGFNCFAKAIGTYFWMLLWTLLWFMLFIIPGIIKSLSYSMMYFILVDNPDVKVRDAMKISMMMTKGYKWKIFVFGLSFIGWTLLGALSLGIGFLWIMPYMQTSFTNLYFKLKEISIKNGVCTPELFSGEKSIVY